MAIEFITIKDSSGVDREVAADQIGVAFAQIFKVAWGADGVLNLVEAASPMPVADSALFAAVDGLEANTTGLATQATLASVLAKLSSDPATQTTLAAVLAKLSADPATQTTLAAVLAKLTADPSTGAKQDTQATKLDTLHTDLTTGTVKTKETGTFGYAAGTAAANVDVPTGARIRRVSVIAGASVAATVTILGGNQITIPAGAAFDEQLAGDALATSSASEVAIAGTVQAYYVSWTV